MTTAIVQAGTLLLHRSVDMNVGASAAAGLWRRLMRSGQRRAGGAGWGWDRFDAESAMQTSVVETAVVREVEMRATAREMVQAVSVAAAYFEDSLQRSPEELLVAGTLGAETVAAMLEESGVEGLRVREMVESGMLEAGSDEVERAAELAGRRAGCAEELMRISVNLANRPFVELRPLFARLRLAMGLLALLAVGLGFWLHALNAKARVARAEMDALKAKTQEYQQERQTNEARMHQPQNMAVLDRSQFLNAIVCAEEL